MRTLRPPTSASKRHDALLILPLCAALWLSLGVAQPRTAHAAPGSAATDSPLAGDGLAVSLDGRVFIVRSESGWELSVLRPRQIRYQPGALPRLGDDVFSPPALIQPPTAQEGAPTICEVERGASPYFCNEEGDPAPGPFACYDFVVVDAPSGGGVMRRRSLTVWVEDQQTERAAYYSHRWTDGVAPLETAAGGPLVGLEPTFTADGRLLIYQGHPSNDGTGDVLMYASNTSPCAKGGWDGPHPLTHMFADGALRNTEGDPLYRLAAEPLRATDGSPFADGAELRGAHPWVFPEGDAVAFTALRLPCRSDGDPVGCGARNAGLSVVGDQTNWALAHIDGGLNPSTTDDQRTFFVSVGSDTFGQIPVSGGAHAWPFFGSNPATYGEVTFDDALDGQYGGVWHMNESIDAAGNIDVAHTPDTSGYFNTANVVGAQFPDANNGERGKALIFGGDGDHLEIPHEVSLNPIIGGLAVEMWVRPTAPVDCSAEPNEQYLLGKGPVTGGSYSLVLEEGQTLRARVSTQGGVRVVDSLVPIEIDAWSHVGFSYSASNGVMLFYVNGAVTNRTNGVSGIDAQMQAGVEPLRIGGPGGDTPPCTNGTGSFRGEIDEVRFSTFARDLVTGWTVGNDSAFVSILPSFPRVEAGALFDVRISFRNIGTTAWSPATRHRLGSDFPPNNVVWGTSRLALPEVVEPGEEVEVVRTLRAPVVPGTYGMRWRMLQDGSGSFGPSTNRAVLDVLPSTIRDAGPAPMDASVDGGPPATTTTGGCAATYRTRTGSMNATMLALGCPLLLVLFRRRR